MTPLDKATQSVPFSNGSEGDAWMQRWCAYCVHDHGIHDGVSDVMCPIIGEAMMHSVIEWRWPEAWIPEPPGVFSLPSHLTCGAFVAFSVGGCTGDPAPVEREARVEFVKAKWAEVGS